ncbi:periplasmic nitrate reductase subunit NapC [Aliiroseovarius crassostreae]|uniref:NapC/NirT family cytochrome c n=1 Tax=Aliiroseovarius crassostreae TaxID=154981 RepID=UPI0008E66ADA|nr:NapC/NirT family cytochrome c [Aliiroseovarius crassostreae]SFU43212.1 periplasmic nitrate reductase subunit NapC [Aliiroseovarius crassostreae]
MSDVNPGVIRRLWNWFWTPTGAISLGALLISGFVAGVVFWGGFNWALEMTNKEEFCISCHEMEDNVFAEYQGSVHQSNRSGVRATCPDCHVPKDWGPKIIRKIKATKELYGHFISKSIWTREKFEDQRIELAANEWRRMKSTDSQECRNCHNFDYMDFTVQENRAADNHQVALDEGKTCIDCHQGIAHELPEGWQERYEQVVDQMAAAGELPLPSGRTVADAKDELEGYLTSGN